MRIQLFDLGKRSVLGPIDIDRDGDPAATIVRAGKVYLIDTTDMADPAVPLTLYNEVETLKLETGE